MEMTRVLGVDVGERRVGLALSDASATLATPLRVMPAGTTPADSARRLAALLRAAGPDDPLREVGHLVIGLPRRLNGEDTGQTPAVRTFAGVLEGETGLPVHLQDERLTSREAEARLAVNDRDWRSRKRRLDAAAAAVILQDYLDARTAEASRAAGTPASPGRER
jgi:putative Holliday junction resolvase